MKREVVAVITDMGQPLGSAIGNALEVKESVDTLLGKGPDDLTELCKILGSHMLLLGKVSDSYEAAYESVCAKLESGDAYEKFIEFVGNQGGNTSNIRDLSLLPKSSVAYEVKAKSKGYVSEIESELIGVAAMTLGAGRESLDSVIEMGAGILLKKKVGDFVSAGDTIATLHTNKSEKIGDAEEMVIRAYSLSESRPKERKLVLAIVTEKGVKIL